MRDSALQVVAILVLVLTPLGMSYSHEERAASDDDVVVFLPLILRVASLAPPANHAPYTPEDPSPAHESAGHPTRLVLGWTGGDPDGDAVTYDVYFVADESAPDILLCDDVATARCDPGALNHGTHYYWQVIATDEHGALATGPVWDFTTNTPTSTPTPTNTPSPTNTPTGTPSPTTTPTSTPTPTNAPPHAPWNPSPADGAADQDDEVTVGWSGGDPDGDAVTYDVYLEANNASPNLLACAGITVTNCDPGPLSWDTHYYWQIVATDGHGATTTGPVWAFWTLAPPQAPTNLTLYFDGYNGPYAIITGEWQDNTDNEAGFEIHYRPRDAGGGDGEVAYVGANVTAFTLDSYHLCDTSGSGGYEAEWWIVAYNDAGTSAADYASATVPEGP